MTTTPLTQPATGEAVSEHLQQIADSITTTDTVLFARRRWHIVALIFTSAVLLFIASALRHHAFRSGALDLAFFDQLTYLISIGQPPINSIANFHLLSDHAAYTLYLIAPLYWI